MHSPPSKMSRLECNRKCSSCVSRSEVSNAFRKHFSSPLAAAKFVYRQEGVRGFWRGTLAPLGSLTASRTLGFIVYRKAKYTIDKIIERTTGSSPLEWVNTAGTYPNLGTVVCFSTAGMVSGAALTPILSKSKRANLSNSYLTRTAPFECLKNAQQTAVLMSKDQAPGGKSPTKVSFFGAARIITRQHGFLGLWKGFNLHLTRDVIGGGVYFGVYESCKQALGSYYGDEMKNTPWAIPLAGAICGISSWVVVSFGSIFLEHILSICPFHEVLCANIWPDLPYRHHEDSCTEQPPYHLSYSNSRRCPFRSDEASCQSRLQAGALAWHRDGDYTVRSTEYDTNVSV